MIVVADTGPLNYLILIEAVDLLEPLYERVVIPQTVAAEMKALGSPAAGSGWISSAPAWLEVVPDPAVDGILADLDPGERAAIATAVLLNAVAFWWMT
jgi:predicted nucleic acid-binding protein